MLGNKLLNIQFAKYHIWNNKSEGFPNMVLSTETFNQSVRTEYSEAVNARYTFQPLWVSGATQLLLHCILHVGTGNLLLSGTGYRPCISVVPLCLFLVSLQIPGQVRLKSLAFSQTFQFCIYLKQLCCGV